MKRMTAPETPEKMEVELASSDGGGEPHIERAQLMTDDIRTRQVDLRELFDGTIYCLIDGPEEGGGTVCDLRTAVETDLPYR